MKKVNRAGQSELARKDNKVSVRAKGLEPHLNIDENKPHTTKLTRSPEVERNQAGNRRGSIADGLCEAQNMSVTHSSYFGDLEMEDAELENKLGTVGCSPPQAIGRSVYKSEATVVKTRGAKTSSNFPVRLSGGAPTSHPNSAEVDVSRLCTASRLVNDRPIFSPHPELHFPGASDRFQSRSRLKDAEPRVLPLVQPERFIKRQKLMAADQTIIRCLQMLKKVTQSDHMSWLEFLASLDPEKVFSQLTYTPDVSENPRFNQDTDHVVEDVVKILNRDNQVSNSVSPQPTHPPAPTPWPSQADNSQISQPTPQPADILQYVSPSETDAKQDDSPETFDELEVFDETPERLNHSQIQNLLLRTGRSDENAPVSGDVISATLGDMAEEPSPRIVPLAWVRPDVKWAPWILDACYSFHVVWTTANAEGPSSPHVTLSPSLKFLKAISELTRDLTLRLQKQCELNPEYSRQKDIFMRCFWGVVRDYIDKNLECLRRRWPTALHNKITDKKKEMNQLKGVIRANIRLKSSRASIGCVGGTASGSMDTRHHSNIPLTQEAINGCTGRLGDNVLLRIESMIKEIKHACLCASRKVRVITVSDYYRSTCLLRKGGIGFVASQSIHHDRFSRHIGSLFEEELELLQSEKSETDGISTEGVFTSFVWSELPRSCHWALKSVEAKCASGGETPLERYLTSVDRTSLARRSSLPLKQDQYNSSHFVNAFAALRRTSLSLMTPTPQQKT